MTPDLLITIFLYYVLYLCFISGLMWAKWVTMHPKRQPRNPVVVSIAIPGFILYWVLAAMLYLVAWIVFGKDHADRLLGGI